jgi:predicted nucleotidyltransferase
MNLQSSRRRSLRRAIARLVRAFAPERIVLFGSHAKGVAQPGSDVDMLIVADSSGAVRKWCKANSLSRDPGSCQLVGKPFEPARAQQRRRR